MDSLLLIFLVVVILGLGIYLVSLMQLDERMKNLLEIVMVVGAILFLINKLL